MDGNSVQIFYVESVFLMNTDFIYIFNFNLSDVTRFNPLKGENLLNVGKVGGKGTVEPFYGRWSSLPWWISGYFEIEIGKELVPFFSTQYPIEHSRDRKPIKSILILMS